MAHDRDPANTTTTAPVAMTSERVRWRLRSRRRSSSRSLGCHPSAVTGARGRPRRRRATAARSGRACRPPCRVASASFTHGHQLAALLEEHPELLLLAGVRLELPDEHAVRDLDRGDVERGRQVGEDRVDLVVLQRLLGGVGALEDQRVLVGLDHVADRGQRGGAGLRAEAQALQVVEAGRLGTGGALERDDGLGRVVVALGEVDDLGALGADRDLVDVEVEVLRRPACRSC